MAEKPAAEELERRREAMRRAMRERNIDALVVAPGATLYYLTGYWGRISRRFTAWILGANDDAQDLFVCPSFEWPLHSQAMIGVERWRGWERTDLPQRGALDAFGEWGIRTGRIALDPQLPWFQALPFTQEAPQASFISAAQVVASVRMVKSPWELERMRRATRAAGEAFVKVAAELEPGTREDAAEGRFKKLADTAEEPTDTWILALFGSSSASPHGVVERGALQSGDVVLVDFGTTRERYHSDTTRTFFFGEVEDEAKRVWEVVQRAYHAAREAARPGITFNQIDAAARKVITDAGYGEFFTHGIGHGVGLEIHEPPYPEPVGDAEMQPGTTITIEPGIYLPGRFGVRLEDTVVIIEDGCEPIDPDPPMQMAGFSEVLAK